MRDENRTEPKENLRVQINYDVSGKQVNYAAAAIMGILGFTFYPSGEGSAEVSRLNQQSILVIQRDVKDLKVSMEIFTTMLIEDNLKAIKHD